MRGLTDRAGRWACEAAATGTRWGKSERAGLQIDVQPFSEIFGRTPVDGTCASRRHEHEPAGARAAAREPALTDRGAFARRRPRPTDKPQTELSGLSAVDWGVQNAANHVNRMSTDLEGSRRVRTIRRFS
jgi:hypothetical protein